MTLKTSLLFLSLAGLAAAETFPVTIRVDLERPGAELKPIWRFFGADEPNYATMSGKKVTVLVWHYHDDDVRGPDAEVRIDLLGAPKGVPKVTRHLVDETHSNSFTAWLAMGSPQKPTAEQIAELEQACKLAPVDEQPRFIEEENLSAVMVTLARQGVTLIDMEWSDFPGTACHRLAERSPEACRLFKAASPKDGFAGATASRWHAVPGSAARSRRAAPLAANVPMDPRAVDDRHGPAPFRRHRAAETRQPGRLVHRALRREEARSGRADGNAMW